MDDPNSAAVANAIQAGQNFWGRVQSLKENRMQGRRLDIAQKQQETESGRLKLDVDESKVRERLVNSQIASADLAQRQAQKAEFLQSHNPLESARQAYGQTQSQKIINQIRPVTDADVQAQNEKQLGKELANRLYPNATAAPGNVLMPMPADPGYREKFGVPKDLQQDTWSVPLEKWNSLAEAYGQHLGEYANQEFNKPFDEMSKDAQQALIESYQKNAPPGVKISDAEAIQAYRSQILHKAPPPSPTDYGLVPTGGEIDPLNPASLKLKLAAPIEGTSLTPDQYKEFGAPLTELITKNKEYQDAQAKRVLVNNVMTHADSPNPSIQSDKSLVFSFLQTIDPSVKINEGNAESFLKNYGIVGHAKEAYLHVIKGQLMTPEEREWFKQAASQNLVNAEQAAAVSIQNSLDTAGATGNPLASKVKLPASISRPGGSKSESQGQGSHEGSAVRKFSTMQQANAAKLPPGTKVLIFDPSVGKYREAVNE